MKTYLLTGLVFWVSAHAALAQTPVEPTPSEVEKPPLDVSKMPFTKEAIAQVMRHNQDKVQSCYEALLADMDKPVQGKLQTSFVITPEGLVKKARVEKKGTTLKQSKLHDCVVSVLTSLTFPKPPDQKDHPVQYPFNLKPVR